MANTKSKKQILQMTQAAMIIAIIILFQVTGIGFIMMPPIAFTILHIPVIIGAVIMGPYWGALFGGAMGLCSLIDATMRGSSLGDLAFSPFYSGHPISSIIMAVVVRILIGLVAGLVFKALIKHNVNDVISAVVAAFLATLTNTAGVMGCLWLLFPKFNLTFKSVLETIFAVNFLIEAGSAILFALAFAKVLPAIIKKRN